MFDLDDTLLKYSQTCSIPDMIDRARTCKMDGYHLAIISNQYGTTKGKITHKDVHDRFEVLKRLLGNDVSFIYSCAKDHYRKPMTGMYHLLKGDREPHADSFYCGDAAGQAGDFAVSDYYFAKNCGVKFYTVPDFKARTSIDIDAGIIPKFQLYRDLDLQSLLIDPPPMPAQDAGPTLIIMIGPQGAGKSTFSESLKDRGYVVLNRDTVGSSAKLFATYKQLIADGKSVVIDNMNYAQTDRSKYLDILPAQYRKICYYFDIKKVFSVHLCHMRVQLGGPYIPPVARHTYYKRLEPPSKEDYDELHVLHGIVDPPKEYYMQYNLIER